MPGVPRSRGCDACRKLKKKCDQAKPSCSRCRRLHIECVGSGVQRFLFVRQKGIPSTETLSIVPSNQTSQAVSCLVGALQVADVRFDLSIYGKFLNEIPRRLGTNEALDASIDALTSAYHGVQRNYFSIEMYEKYGKGLKALRKCLLDPIQVKTPETLCATYLIMICHGWVGESNDQSVGHGEALSYLVDAASSQNWQDTFEMELLKTLRPLVIFESFFNHKAVLYSWFQNVPESVGPVSHIDATSSVESLKPSNMGRLPGMVRNPDNHILEIDSVYTQLRIDCKKMSCLLEKIQSETTNKTTSSATGPSNHEKRLVRYQTGCAVLLCLALIFNAILYSYDTSNCNKLNEAEALIDDVIKLVKDAVQYRPIASSFMPVPVVFGYAITKDKHRQAQLETILKEFQDDFVSSNWLQLGEWMRKRMDNPSVAFFGMVVPQFEGLRRKACRCYSL